MVKREIVERFEVVFEPDEEGLHVYVPALKGCHSWGAIAKKRESTSARPSNFGLKRPKKREFLSLTASSSR
jgi:hypothetical protein